MFSNSGQFFYRPVFLDRNWILRQFQGWTCVYEDSNSCLLRLKSWTATRYLMMGFFEISQLDSFLLNNVTWHPCTRVTIKCFNMPWDQAPASLLVGRKLLSLVNDKSRMLNKFTFVISLEDSEALLWGRFNDATKRKCRMMSRTSPKFTTISDPHNPCFNTFVTKLAMVSEERNLQMPSISMLHDILLSGFGALHVLSDSELNLSMVLLYSSGDKVYYLYGITLIDTNIGAGHLIHWEAIRHYKNLGYKWYDFGGVSSIDDTNGIYRFKRGYGGNFVDLGAEYIWQGVILETALKCRKRF